LNELYRRLLEFTHDGVYRYTLDEGVVLFANQGLVDILDLDDGPARVVGRPLRDLLIYTAKEGAVRNALDETGEIHNFEYHFKTLKGEDKWVLHDSFIVNDPDTGQRIVEAIVKDITYRKQAERALVVEKERLARSEKLVALGKLAGGVSHDLRNPLSAIANGAYFLKMAVESEDAAVNDTIEIIDQEVARAEEIISSMLDFRPPRQPERRPTDLCQVVRDVLGRAEIPEGIEVDIGCEMSAATVSADAGQLDRAFSNIITNAIQAMPEGGRLTIRCESSGPDLVAVSFSDTGVGIAHEDQAMLFEPLFTTKQSGIGFGLAVVKTVIEGHEGCIDVKSRPGEGSQFRVYLPLGGR
jgi:two-component system, NtrC family, sensor kinase